MAVENWAGYDHLAVAAESDPASTIKRLQSEAEVGHSQMHGGFHVITRYNDVVAAARDDRFSSDPVWGPGPGFPNSSNLDSRLPMIMDDGNRHSQFRMPIQRLFSPTFAKSLRSEVEQICDRLIDNFIETGFGDLADQYSIELPAVLIAKLLDLPLEKRRDFQNWASVFVATMDASCQHNIQKAVEELYDLRQESPGEDIPSKLLTLEVEGRPIAREEWCGLVMLLILGGLDTTANAGGYIFEMIGRSEEIRGYLLADLANIKKAVPEFVRYISPVPQHSRGLTQAATIGNADFVPGDVVQLSWLAANHDPSAFPDPEKFDPDRRNSHHVGFGHGRHMCLGRHLAIVELEVMIERILARLPDFKVIEGGTERFASLNRGMRHMKVSFTPGPRMYPVGEFESGM